MVCIKVEPKNVLKLSKNYIPASDKVLEDQKLKREKFRKFLARVCGPKIFKFFLFSIFDLPEPYH